MILPPRNPLHGQRHAIVIGANGSSASGLAPLIAPEAHDAPRMAAVLASPACGFHVQPFLGEQALMQPIRDAIETQMKTGTIDDSLIIYFAGHGTITKIDVVSDVVLVTTDTTLDSIMDDPLTCLRIGWLKTLLCENTQTYPIGHVVVILDCCYSGMIVQLGHQPLIGDPPAFRRMLVSTYTTKPAYEWNRTSLYTYHLINALEGQAVDSFGAVTMERVHQYCSDKLAGTGQQCGLDGWDYTGRWQFAWYDLHRPKVVYAAQQVESDRLLNLRLEGFVGRVNELAAIREHIEAMRPTGGYVLIKAAAGEGKSSTIAKLIHEAGIEQTLHHFIALTTDPKYQLGLLRAVVAQLILKHNLTVSYFPEESYPAMKGEFARILDGLSKHGIKETIYLDGLDQLQPEIDGSRDLSFLPPQPPPGIVIVLGSRPDETLKPLKILHRVDYALPPLSEGDALTLWRSVQSSVAVGLLYDLYRVLKGNALFVHLAANTMQGTSVVDATSMIRKIEQNPQNLFGITLDRVKNRSEFRWPTIWRPMVALLVVTQEPLLLGVIGRFLGQPRAVIQDAVWVMGGLVSQGIDQRVALHHLLFRDYLQVHEFDVEELRDVHQRLADWCAQDVDAIWNNHTDVIEQARRMYARHHYITHLSLAENWPMLWHVLDAGDYGEQKTRFDPSTRLYALDLDRGRESAINAGQSTEEHIQNIPRLWKYSLLRTSLSSRVDQWPDEAFEILAMVGRTHEALERIALLSDAHNQISCWIKIIPWCDEKQRHSIIAQIYQAVNNLSREDQFEVFTLLIETTATLGNTDQAMTILNTALDIAHSINDSEERVSTLIAIAKTITTLGHIDQAMAILDTALAIPQPIDGRWRHASNLIAIAESAAILGHADQATTILDRALTTTYSIYDPKDSATGLTSIAMAIATFGHTDQAIIILDTALVIAYSIDDPWQHVFTLRTIAKAIVTLGHAEQAMTILDKALNTVSSIDDPWQHDLTLRTIAEAAATVGKIDYALAIARSIDDSGERDSTLQSIAKAVATVGNIDHALAIAHSIYNPWQHAFAISTIAKIVATVGNIDHALAITSSIDDSEKHVSILITIANAIATLGNTDQAMTILETALAITQSIDDSEERASTLIAIAKAVATLGNTDQVMTILETAFAISHSIDDRWQHASNLINIAESAAIQSHAQQSMTILEYALTIAHSIDDLKERASTLITIAKAMAILGYTDQAMTILDTNLAIAYPIDPSLQRNSTLQSIAEAVTTVGNIDHALAIAHSIDKPSQRDSTLRAIAEAVTTVGNIDYALAIAHSIDDLKERASTFMSIVKVATDHGYTEQTIIILDTTLAIINSIDHPWTHASSIMAIIKTASLVITKIASATYIHTEQAKTILDITLAIAKSTVSLEGFIPGPSIARSTERSTRQTDERSTRQADPRRLIIESTTTIENSEQAMAILDLAFAIAKESSTASSPGPSIARSTEHFVRRADTIKLIVQTAQSVTDALTIIQKEWFRSKIADDLWEMASIITPLLKDYPWLGIAILEEEKWVNNQLRQLG